MCVHVCKGQLINFFGPTVKKQVWQWEWPVTKRCVTSKGIHVTWPNLVKTHTRFRWSWRAPPLHFTPPSITHQPLVDCNIFCLQLCEFALVFTQTFAMVGCLLTCDIDFRHYITLYQIENLTLQSWMCPRNMVQSYLLQ